MEFLQNVWLANLQLLMNTSANQANSTETVGVVGTRFCGQTDRPTDWFQNTPHKLHLGGYNQEIFKGKLVEPVWPWPLTYLNENLYQLI